MKAVLLIVAALVWGAVSHAQPVQDQMALAQVVVLGEVHDNPHHHERQAGFVGQIKPRALVFEMLTEAQAASVSPDNRTDRATLEQALGWKDTGWPDFGMYFPIIAAAPQAVIYGAAVPREAARAAMKDGIADWFGPDATAYGLTSPLSEDAQTQREALQMEAHCNALPEEMLPVMVDLQRLRDAVLARATLRALDETGGPVVVITGNGHARKDWGAPSYVTMLRPDVLLFSVGQTEEDDASDPAFDIILSAPATPREDPCKAFR